MNDGINENASPDEQDQNLADLFEAMGIVPFADANKSDANPEVPVDSEGAQSLGDDSGSGDPASGAAGEAGGDKLSEYDSVDTVQEIRNMISDVSAILTPMELCSLIDGSANYQTISVVMSLLDRMYPINDSRGWTVTRVKDLFSSIGNLIDPSYCEAVLNTSDALNGKSGASLADLFCESDEAVDIRRELLKDKGK